MATALHSLRCALEDSRSRSCALVHDEGSGIDAVILRDLRPLGATVLWDGRPLALYAPPKGKPAMQHVGALLADALQREGMRSPIKGMRSPPEGMRSVARLAP